MKYWGGVLMMENLRRACEAATSEKLGGYYDIWTYVAVMIMAQVLHLLLTFGTPRIGLLYIQGKWSDGDRLRFSRTYSYDECERTNNWHLKVCR